MAASKSRHVLILLFLTASAALASAGSSIICMTSLPTSSSTSTSNTTRAAVFPKIFAKQDGFEVCTRHQVSCNDTSASSTACSPEEIQAGNWKWVYGAMSSEKCKLLQSQPGSYKNVLCCIQRSCNSPDPAMDPDTKLAAARPAGSSPTRSAGRPATAAPVAKTKAGQQHHTKQHRLRRHAHRSSSTGAAAGGSSITCFHNVHRAASQQPAVAPKTYRKVDGVDMCARYQFQCSAIDETCSAAEARGKIWKWAYMPLSSSTCMELRSYAKKRNDAVIRNITCCAATNCNRPDPNLDVLTQVVEVKTLRPTGTAIAKPSSAKKAPTSSKLSAGEPAAMARSSTSVKASAVAAATTAAAAAQGDTESGQLEVKPLRLACYTSLPRSLSQAPAVAPKIYHKSSDGVDVCSRYQLQCTQLAGKEAACTAAEAEAGAWIWEYKPLRASLCKEMQAIAAMGAESGYRSVSCCSSSGCNKPDASVDKVTKVVQKLSVPAARVYVARAGRGSEAAAAAKAAGTATSPKHMASRSNHP